MLFDLATVPPRICYKLLVSTITPRPIAWVVSLDAHGALNAAPFSFFNAFSSDPPVIGIGIGPRSGGRTKDTRANIADTGEFVVNLVSEDTAEAMNVTAIEFEPDVDLGPTNCIALGRVLAIHVRDDAVLDAASGSVDTPALHLIGRMHGTGWYARTSDRFEMPRIPVGDWKRHPDR